MDRAKDFPFGRLKKGESDRSWAVDIGRDMQTWRL
jgi:hypothetical protein